MNKIKAYFFLLLIIAVQFTSSGFAYYVNSCSISGVTSVTNEKMNCRCSSDNLKFEKHKDIELEFNKICCQSIEHFINGVDKLTSNSLDLNFDPNFRIEQTNATILDDQLKEWRVIIVSKPNCDPPPLLRSDRLILMQSFII